MYSKQINPLLISFLNYTSISIEKLEKSIDKAGGKFIHTDYIFTRERYQKAQKILEEPKPLNKQNLMDFFAVFDAIYTDKNIDLIDLPEIYEFLDQIEEVLKDYEFAKKHTYTGFSMQEISFKKYLKVVYDDRIELLKTPLEIASPYVKIHGIWEVQNTEKDREKINEPSYLFGHCTRTTTSCWPIISEGLRLPKHGGGRCGRGIYFSNDVSKCLDYCSFTYNGYGDKSINYGLLFLVQVFTGRVKQITNDDNSLTESTDYDSVHAIGRVSPKSTVDIWHSDNTSSKIYIDNTTYEPKGYASSFKNNEFVIYNEKRCQLRYIILFSKQGSRFF